ncbi:hypothetical protein OG218_00350 [Kineococcus sp. NBC_00420]|uniref:hypothetical protein n=1 Tax=Kineococcus sp. NBC_00420 TaxID=2903564 RepID=UPI002E1C98E6
MTGIPVSSFPASASARTWSAPISSTAAGGEPAVQTSGSSASATPATDPAQVAAQVAHTAGITSSSARGAFTAFLKGQTSTAALWSVSGSNATAGTLPSPALAGVTFDQDGIPDFSAIVKAGGKVTGALPPDGQSVWTINFNGRRIVQYAVEIDRGDGSKPVLLKGVNVNCDSSVDRAGRQDALVDAAKMFAAMPNSLEEVRTRCWGGRSPWTAPQRSVDVRA